jgi:hypothetical protein
MTVPGPWIQPADVLRTANRTVFGGFNSPYTSSLVQAQAATFSALLSASMVVPPLDEVASPSTSTYLDHETVSTVGGGVSLIRFEPQFVSLAAVPPSSADLAAPHVIGYEYEGGDEAQGVLVGPMIARSWLRVAGDWSFTFDTIPPTGEPVAYSVFEMIEGADYSLSPVVFGGSTFQQVHALLYPNQGVLAGRTEIASNNTGNMPFEVGQNALTGVSWEVPSSLPAYAFAAHNLVDGNDMVGSDGSSDYSPSVDFSAWVRPPRYRLLYDQVPPQRQYPRDDGLGMSTKRSWPPSSSKQSGLRRGPVGTYL